MLNKRQMSFIAITVCFVLPFIMAIIAQQMGWFSSAKTNKGTLLQPVLELERSSWPESLTKTWTLIYVSDRNCHDCESAAYLMQQVKTALGRNSYRVQLVSNHKMEQDSQVVDVQTHGRKLVEGYLYISDPLGFVMLKYPIEDQREGLIDTAKDVLSDLTRLLKLSKVG